MKLVNLYVRKHSIPTLYELQCYIDNFYYDTYVIESTSFDLWNQYICTWENILFPRCMSYSFKVSSTNAIIHKQDIPNTNPSY
jgi:hypothetical protein